MDTMKFIIEAIIEIEDLKENQGKIECPKCKGELHYTRTKSNGHVWGKCRTKDCLTWRQ